jgi:anti-sigma B factor antagonist
VSRKPLSLDRIALRVNRSQPAFVCSSTTDGSDAAWVQVAGELDLATRPQLVRTLRRCQLQARVVVLDLRKLEFMDSSGAHAIINATMRARRLGGRLVLLGVRRNVHRVFTLTGSSGEVDIGELDLTEPPARLPPRLAEEALSP